MKCPKCGYLGFESVDRCRNCGYDFSLTPPDTLPELPIRPEAQSAGPLDDLALFEPPRDDGRFTSGMDANLDRLLGVAEPAVPAPAAPTPPRAPSPSLRRDLPLFGPPIADDVPLITKASPPRSPLAVRRATPEPGRPRADVPRATPLDLSLDLGPPERDAAGERAGRSRVRDVEWPDPQTASPNETAGVAARLAAVVIDLLILAAVDIAVVYFTMQICGLTPQQFAMLPKAPLLAFILVQNGGYLVAFTVGGQTLGKMAAGVKVVPAEPDATIDVGHALLRTAVWLLLAVPAGLGFVSAFFDPDRRGLHDRFAGTRVIRASV
jgi:uncharacterized RDD family membrane protein YckC